MHRIALKGWVLFVAAAVALGGCSGSGEGLDNSGRPLGEAANLPLTATFDSIQAHVFTPICTACHAGANAPQGLRLDAANSYNLLVGVPSAEVPSIQRVKPGDPQNSYIIQKLEGRAAVGVQMPFGGPYLSAETIAVIRQWITDGAQRTPSIATTNATSFELATAVPADGDVVSAAPSQVMLGFNRELDATRADATTVRLERFEPENPELPAQVIQTSVSVPAVNPQTLVLSPPQPLAAGHYRVVVSGGGASDLGGQRLAGTEQGSERVVATFAVETSQ